MSDSSDETPIKPAPGAEPDTARLRRWVAYVLFGAGVRAAMRGGVELDTLTELVSLAAYRETRRQGLTQQQAVKSLGVSQRTISKLSTRLKETFAETDVRALGRRVQFMLWSQPMTLVRLSSALGLEAEVVESVLSELVADGRVTAIPGPVTKYRVERAQSRFDPDDLLARLDGLEAMLHRLEAVVEARFFDADGEAQALNFEWHQPVEGGSEVLARAVRGLIDAITGLDALAQLAEQRGEPVESRQMSLFGMEAGPRET